jgi:hypothetical protein
MYVPQAQGGTRQHCEPLMQVEFLFISTNGHYSLHIQVWTPLKITIDATFHSCIGSVKMNTLKNGFSPDEVTRSRDRTLAAPGPGGTQVTNSSG